ncbi:MAG: Clp protease N-terminal domain-containing protein [Alphaproteobacteria bacterium]
MAEISGFATDLAQSAYLESTMRRAIAAAQQRSHRYVTLEHLLLALLEDPDAQALLESMNIDRQSMKARTTDIVNRSLATLYTPGQFDLRASYKVERVLQTASDDARRLNCSEVDAAFVLAAVAHETDCLAAEVIKPTGLTFSNAMTWLYTHRGSSHAVSQPNDAPSEADAEYDADMAMDEDLDDLAFDLEILDETPAPSASPPPRAKQAAPENAPQAVQQATPQAAPSPEEGAQQRPYPPQSSKYDAIAAAKQAHLALHSQTNQFPNGVQREGAMPPPSHSTSAPSAREDLPPQAKRRPPQGVPPAAAGHRRSEMPPGTPSRGLETAPPPREAPAAAPPNAESRAEVKVPSVSRLDEMRVRPGGASSSAPSPVAAPSGKKVSKNANAKNKKKQRRPAAPGSTKQAAAGGVSAPLTPGQMRRQRRQSWLEAQAGRLVENIPRRMRVAQPERVEVRISREETDAITKGFDGRGEIIRHDVLVSQAMSVMLRAPDGGFSIETLSPETQWTSDGSDHRTNEVYGRWRWAVTPRSSGNRRLQLIVSARSVDENGMTGDTALPDQVITVRVRTNYWLSIKRTLAWLVVMALGGVVTELAVRALKIFDQSGG